MSFLNPVNEPVKRFSSTDADAPKINYNARVAGDVKTVLKACLVTGYGAKTSAGWSIVNEVDHVAEFVSPNITMIDYRLGIDDTSASSTTWYYQYQDARVNPINNSLNKGTNFIDKSSASNGWQLLVTERGIYFIEVFFNTVAAATIARLTYWGQIKSALLTGEKNIGFWSGGGTAPQTNYSLFKNNGYTGTHYNVGSYAELQFSCASLGLFNPSQKYFDISSVELLSALYLVSGRVLVGEQPGFLIRDVVDTSRLFGVSDGVLDGRPVINICVAPDDNRLEQLQQQPVYATIYLDYWEY